jgi:hypothetical protein
MRLKLPRLDRSIKHLFPIKIRLLTVEEVLVEHLSAEKSWDTTAWAAEAALVRSLVPL